MAYHWDVVAEEMQQNFYNRLGIASWNLYQFDQHPDILKNVRHFFTRLNGCPIQGQELLDMCEEIRENYTTRTWRRDNFCDLVSNFVNEQKETHHDNSSSLTAIHQIIDADHFEEETLNVHLHRAVTDRELPDQFAQEFLDFSDQLRTMIVEYQHGEENNTAVSLLFVVFQALIEGQKCAIPEPVFRIQIGPDAFAFVDRSSYFYPTWDDYLLNSFMLQGRYCYPENGVYTADATNHVLVAFYGTHLEDDDDDEDEISQRWRFFLEHYNTPYTTISGSPTIPVCVEPFDDTVGARISAFLAEAFGQRSVWLPLVAGLLSEAASRVHVHIKETSDKGRVYGRPARIAAGALYASAATAYACSVANILSSLPEKYKQQDTLTMTLELIDDTLTLYSSARSLHVHLRQCAEICRELLKSQARKGVGKRGRCVYGVIARDFYKTVSARVGVHKVKMVAKPENDIGLAGISRNEVHRDV